MKIIAMCDICEKGKEISSNVLWIVIRDGVLITEPILATSDTLFHERVQINYCPFCGKEIERKKDV